MATTNRKKDKLQKLLKDIKERRVLPKLFFYIIGAVGLLASVYELYEAEKIRSVALIFCITGVPAVLITSYFHGKFKKNRVPAIEIVLLSICGITGGLLAIKVAITPTPITILIRMMAPQEEWFIDQVLTKFNEDHHTNVEILRFETSKELLEILQSQAKRRNAKRDVSLVKVPLHLSLVLFKEKLVDSYDNVLRGLGHARDDIHGWRSQNESIYTTNTLELGTYCTVTGTQQYYLPRKLETRFLVYRKSKVAEAVMNWRQLSRDLVTVLRHENGYGLPKNYDLEPDPNSWDFYDLFVAGYYWANTPHGGQKSPRIAHRSRYYAGTVLGLIDKALQLGATKGDIMDMYRFSEAIVDMVHWEAVFRKYDLYSNEMWSENGWAGADICEAIAEGTVFLSWMHQLDCALIYEAAHRRVGGRPAVAGDLGVAIMPQGVSFALTREGRPSRIGSRKGHTFGWMWGIPKNAPEPELAYKLARYTTSDQVHLAESSKFLIIPVTQTARRSIARPQQSLWHAEVLTKSIEQLEINGKTFIPRFRTALEYKTFVDTYYRAFEHIVIKQRYTIDKTAGAVDRRLIRENLK